MCGIIGIINAIKPIGQNWTKKNLSKILHRGPDNDELWNSKDQFVFFGHTRLSILDLSSKNNQPLEDEDANICLTFNGEIYNYIELRNELKKLGYKFKTNGDTEVLLKSYIQWKEDSFKKIEGMFAFAICDEKRKKIFLVRDQFGQKPLFFKYTKNILKFGSELQIFLDDEDIKLNQNNLNKYLYNGYVKNKSLIDNLSQVPPGQYLQFEYTKRKISFKSHWEVPTFEKKNKSNSREILNLLKDSLVKQFRSDVPSGFLLSGGIDSSLLVSLASEISQKKIITFNVSNNDPNSIKESENASLISKLYNTEHTNLNINKLDIYSFLDILKKFSEPIIDSSIVPTYSIYNKVKDQCKVIFGGDGGDELFGGYNHFKNFLRYNLLKSFSQSIPKRINNYFNKDDDFYRKGYMYLNLINSGQAIIDIPNFFNNHERSKIFKDPNLFSDVSLKKIVGQDIGMDSMKNSFKNYLPEDIMTKIDRCSMLNSLEARTPFLDKKLVSYIFKNTLGSEHVSLMKNRILQKKISKSYLPKKILNQKKRGFSFNLSTQLKDKEWKNEIYSILTSKDSLFSELFINYLFQMSDKGFVVSEKIFGLLFFEIWRKKYNLSI